MKPAIFIVMVLAALLAGCGDKPPPEPVQSDRPPALTVAFGEQTFAFEPTYAAFATLRRNLILTESAIVNRPERVPATVHRIYLANYDLQLTDPAQQDYRRIDADGQLRVEIQIEADRDAPADAPVRPGEYRPASEPFNRVSWIGIARYRNGKDAGTMLAGTQATGTVAITSATPERITGELDVSDADGRVRGRFAAQRLQERP